LKQATIAQGTIVSRLFGNRWLRLASISATMIAGCGDTLTRPGHALFERRVLRRFADSVSNAATFLFSSLFTSSQLIARSVLLGKYIGFNRISFRGGRLLEPLNNHASPCSYPNKVHREVILGRVEPEIPTSQAGQEKVRTPIQD
jgi:hypothetical protein